MDWDSIKRNFRFRSGRAKRAEKRYPSHPPSRTYDPHGNSPSHPAAPARPLAPRPLPNTSKPSTGADGPNTKPKHITPSSRDQTTKTSNRQPLQVQVNSMEYTNGAAMQPKQKKGASYPQGEKNNTNAAPPAQSTDDTDDFDLRPQPRKKKPTSIDLLSESLFSGGHLDTILHDSQLFIRFTTFLNRYRPSIAPILVRYLEIQKAIKAVEYANAVAESVAPLPSDTDSKKDMTAAHVDTSFQEMRQDAFQQLLSEALPAYITYSLIKVVTEIMVNEITGRSTPIMKGLVSGLSEIFCLTDPNQEDNPIIYASEEFYHMTGYSRDFVIGNNCRFLQGPKTKRHSVQRLRQAVDSGQELSEALLNYRRDGRPFLNILMIAPLYDNKGNVKYHIGAQVNASGLIEGGKGLDGFEKYLSTEQAKADSRGRSAGGKEPLPSRERLTSKEAKNKALDKLGELSEMFDLEENAIVAQRSRSNSRERRSEDEESTGSGKSRRVFNESSDSELDEEGVGEKEKAAWTLSQSASSGKLPGVYQSYFLMRPSPSLKIIFTSPALKKMGNLVQSTLLSHITAPPATLKGLNESFEAGNPVTAKVLFSAQASEYKIGRELDRGQNKKAIEEASSSKLGRTCWISATPLLGGDDEVGVWMVVLVDQRSLGSGTSHKLGNDTSRQTPLRKGASNQKSDATQDSPASNSTHTPTSKTPRPTHIALPDRTETQRKTGTQQTDSANQSSREYGSPQPQKPSMKPQRTPSGHDIMVRRDERLHREQNTYQSNKESIEKADEFVRRYEPRKIEARPGRVHIQPDTEDEDEDFQLATETGVENGIDHDLVPEGRRKVPEKYGSVPGVEADTMTQKESNILARTEPEETSKDGPEDQSVEFAAPKTTAKPVQKTTQVSQPETELERVSESEKIPRPEKVPESKKGPVSQPETKSEQVLGSEKVREPATEPLSEQALQLHNETLATAEKAKESIPEPQALSNEERHMSPSNQIEKDPESDPQPPGPAETEAEEGEYAPTSIKNDHEPKVEHDGNGNGNSDDTNTSIEQYDNAREGDESSHAEPGPADLKTAAGFTDYLRHPGSRPAPRGGRAVTTATNLGSQGHTMGELGSHKWDRHEDPDCDMRTPFSVD